MTNDWIEWHWTPEKPYPEKLDTLVRIKCSDGYTESNIYYPDKVRGWIRSDESLWDQSYGYGCITHYKLA